MHYPFKCANLYFYLKKMNKNKTAEIKNYLLAIMVSADNKLDDHDLPTHVTLAYWTQEKQREAELLEELQNKCLWLGNIDCIEIGKNSSFKTPKGKKEVLLLKKSEAMEVLQEKVFEVAKQFSLEKEEQKWFGGNWNPHISFIPKRMEENKVLYTSEIKLFRKVPKIGKWELVKTFW